MQEFQEINEEEELVIVDDPEPDHKPAESVEGEASAEQSDPTEKISALETIIRQREEALVAMNNRAEQQEAALAELKARMDSKSIDESREQNRAAIDALKKKAVELLDEGKFQEGVDVQEELAVLTARQELYNNIREAQKHNQDSISTRQQPTVRADVQQSTKLPPAQEQWMERNDWFHNPAKASLRQKANDTYLALINAGYSPEDHRTYAELDKRLNMQKPPPTVPPSGAINTQSSSQRLRENELVNMKRFGLDPNNKDHRLLYLKSRTQREAQGR